MAGHKSNRNAEDIRRELSAILYEMKDPRISENFISIVRVDVASDLSNCKVYISSMKGIEKSKEASKVLGKSSGFVRHELGSRLKLRHVPTLQFYATDSIEYSANISKILNTLDIKEDENEDNENDHQ